MEMNVVYSFLFFFQKKKHYWGFELFAITSNQNDVYSYPLFHILTNNLWGKYISICTLKYISLHELEKMCCIWFVSWLQETAEDERKKIQNNILYNWDHYCTYFLFLIFPFLPIVFPFIFKMSLAVFVIFVLELSLCLLILFYSVQTTERVSQIVHVPQGKISGRCCSASVGICIFL